MESAECVNTGAGPELNLDRESGVASEEGKGAVLHKPDSTGPGRARVREVLSRQGRAGQEGIPAKKMKAGRAGAQSTFKGI